MSEYRVRDLITKLMFITLFLPIDIEGGYIPIIIGIFFMPISFIAEMSRPDFQYIFNIKYIIGLFLLAFPYLVFPFILLMNWRLTNSKTNKNLIIYQILLVISLILILYQVIFTYPSFMNWVFGIILTLVALGELWIKLRERDNSN